MPKGKRPIDTLTPHDRRIIALVAEGLSNRQVGEELQITERTVKNEMYRIFIITGAENRMQLATAWMAGRFRA
jgi:two-component system response regulator DevR